MARPTATATVAALPPSVAAAFAKQAAFCRQLDAPFTAAMCDAALIAFAGGGASARAVHDWAGEPMADALMMRVTGAFNGLVRAGCAPELAPLYPPAPLPDVAALAAAIRGVLDDPARDVEVLQRLASPPQTNEVARSGVLMPGMMVIAQACALPLRIFELGCSAGLNLNMDRFCYDLGGLAAGDPASPVRLAPVWRGNPPPASSVMISERRGVDIQPLDVQDAATRARLMAYVWPEQTQRVLRSEAAIALAMANPPAIEQGDAASFVEAAVAPRQGSVGVVFHSIAFQYFPAPAKARIEAHLEQAGRAASPSAPLAWLRYEMDDPNAADLPTLRLRLWRGGAPEETLLARAHPHGTFLEWLI
jgi:hypothetical protein